MNRELQAKNWGLKEVPPVLLTTAEAIKASGIPVSEEAEVFPGLLPESRKRAEEIAEERRCAAVGREWTGNELENKTNYEHLRQRAASAEKKLVEQQKKETDWRAAVLETLRSINSQLDIMTDHLWWIKNRG